MRQLQALFAVANFFHRSKIVGSYSDIHETLLPYAAALEASPAGLTRQAAEAKFGAHASYIFDVLVLQTWVRTR
jgi:hypothetical protein